MNPGEIRANLIIFAIFISVMKQIIYGSFTEIILNVDGRLIPYLKVNKMKHQLIQKILIRKMQSNKARLCFN